MTTNDIHDHNLSYDNINQVDPVATSKRSSTKLVIRGVIGGKARKGSQSSTNPPGHGSGLLWGNGKFGLKIVLGLVIGAGTTSGTLVAGKSMYGGVDRENSDYEYITSRSLLTVDILSADPTFKQTMKRDLKDANKTLQKEKQADPNSAKAKRLKEKVASLVWQLDNL